MVSWYRSWDLEGRRRWPQMMSTSIQTWIANHNMNRQPNLNAETLLVVVMCFTDPIFNFVLGIGCSISSASHMCRANEVKSRMRESTVNLAVVLFHDKPFVSRLAHGDIECVLACR